MARPKSDHPTPNELEVLKLLWDQGPCTVRQVMDALNSGRHRRYYTSIMSLLSVMTDKGLLSRQPQGRAFLYRAAVGKERTLGHLLEDLLRRAFAGSTSALIAHLLDHRPPSPAELDEIHRMIERYNKQ
jgi:BlaI family transcriptional regulator, penicillinase repressor